MIPCPNSSNESGSYVMNSLKGVCVLTSKSLNVDLINTLILKSLLSSKMLISYRDMLQCIQNRFTQRNFILRSFVDDGLR